MSPNLNRATTSYGDGQASSDVGDSPILRGVYVHRRGENGDDERLVSDFWRAGGIDVESLEHPSEQFSRLPDLRLNRAGKPWAFCEVKTVWRHRWSVRILHEDRPVEERVEVSNLGVDERISGDLVTAVRQLRVANPHHSLFNFVFLVNRDKDASITDLTRIFSAKHSLAGRSLESRRAAKLAAEIQDFRREVDLCTWATVNDERALVVEGYFLFNPELREPVRNFAGLGSATLVPIETAA